MTTNNLRFSVLFFVRKIKKMLNNPETNINNDSKNETLLRNRSLSLVKRIALFIVGLGGLFVLSLLFGLIYSFVDLPKDEKSAQLTLVTYAALILALFSIIFLDIPRLIDYLKEWKGYAMGIAIGIIVIVFDIAYSNIVNLFYQSSVNQNEESVRGVIDIYPIASILILGIVGPICEELTYRVGLFGAIKRYTTIGAYIVTSLVFGAIHFGFTNPNIYDELVSLPMYVFSGLAFSFAYDKFGFQCSAVAHMTNNLWAVVLRVIAKAIGQ